MLATGGDGEGSSVHLLPQFVVDGHCFTQPAWDRQCVAASSEPDLIYERMTTLKRLRIVFETVNEALQCRILTNNL